MKNMLEEKQREILNKKYQNQDLSDDTQTAIKKI